MHQANEVGTRRKPHHGLPGGSGNAASLATRKDGPALRLRVVRAPGGFAFVADEPAAEKGD